MESSFKAIFYAFLANLGIGITKFIAAIITGSGSMMAEAIHSFADTSNQILLFIGLKRSKRKPDDKHPLGYGKTIYFWSFLVAVLLFSMGGVFSIYEGIHKIYNPEPIHSLWLAITVLGISILLEIFSLIGAITEINKIKKQIPLFKWLKESRNPELIVVFGEDVAALIGLIIAFIFVCLSYFWESPIFDSIGSICIGVLLIVISVMISIRIKSMIIGESASESIKNQIQKMISNIPEVEKVFNVITVQLGPDIMVTMKIKMNSNLNIQKAVEILNLLEKNIKKEIPEIRWSFIEPDISD